MFLTAFNYNVLYREAKESVIAAAVRNDMGIVVGSVLGQGFLARRADDEVRRRPMWLSEARRRQFLAYYQLLDDAAISPVEMGLRFAISDPCISTIRLDARRSSISKRVSRRYPGAIVKRSARTAQRDRSDGSHATL